MASLQPSSKILIIGSGVFGLSTALWLARAGYTDVTVFDMQDTYSTGYAPSAGVDSASADINKIIRFSYGNEIEYQRLASEAAVMWESWNQQLATIPEEKLPQVLRCSAESQRARRRKLWVNSGMLRMSGTAEFGTFELETLRNMEREGIRDRQFKSDQEDDLRRATQRGWSHKIDFCGRQERLGVHKAVLDSTAGYVAAYKSCAWAQNLAREIGVKFILDPKSGTAVKVDSVNEKPMLETADGAKHQADLIVVAAGGWTPSLVSQVHAAGLLEATAGSVATVQLPQDRPDLWERFSPENCPVITWGMKEGLGVYSFPRDDNGVIKIGYRATKWTNYDNFGSHKVSVPRTAHVTTKKETNIPLKSLDAIKAYLDINLPELVEFGISSTKLCWYTDSIDNSFLVDYVPGLPGVAVCSGGSGHGFKFLPILGREVVKILCTAEDTVYRKMWQWRSSEQEKRNGLEEGDAGPRVLDKQKMASERDWVWVAAAVQSKL